MIDTPEARMTRLAGVEGVDYSPAGIDEVREALIEWRNAALSPETFNAGAAILLSHAVALLARMKELEARYEQDCA